MHCPHWSRQRHPCGSWTGALVRATLRRNGDSSAQSFTREELLIIRRLAPTAVLGAAALAAALPAPAHAASDKPAATTTVSSCKVAYGLTGAWNGRTTGFTSTMRIWNTGSAPVKDWTLKFTFSGSGQKVTKLWSAAWSQSSSTITAKPLAFDKVIQPGKSLTLGLLASGVNGNPTTARLSGTSCAETVFTGKVLPGMSETLIEMIEGYAASGDLRAALLRSLRGRA